VSVFSEAQSHVGALQHTDQLTRVVSASAIVRLEVVAALCPVQLLLGLWAGCQGHLNALVVRLVDVRVIRVRAGVYIFFESCERVGLDRGSFVLLVTEGLFLLLHAVLVLDNLGFVGGHVVQVDLARPHVQARLVKALLQVLSLTALDPHNARVVQVTVVVRRHQVSPGSGSLEIRHLACRAVDTVEADVVLCKSD
jgi:hypothetical protein